MAKAAAGKIKIVAIIASLAALALVLSPTFSLVQIPGTNSTGTDGFPADAEFIPDDTVVEQVSDEDLAACNSVNRVVHEILGARNNTVDERSVASDKLIAEFCSRPVLIHEIMSSDYQGMSLVAYACDASYGRIGTAAMKDSLSEHKEIYCDSGRKLIVNETNTFLATVEQFRTEYLPLLGAGFENETGSFEDDEVGNSAIDSEEETSAYFNVTAAEMTLDEVTLSLEKCMELLDAEEYYNAAKSFDSASKKFIALFSENEEEKA